MLAGHVGAALAIGRAETRINVGVFVTAALLLDVLLWILVLAGWESAAIPADFASTHQAAFIFPWSHGLAASLAWALLAGVGVMLWRRRSGGGTIGAGLLIGAAVFSHWLLDALVHIPELPLAGAGSPKVGLGLWQNMPAAIAIEGLIVAAGLWMFLQGTALARPRAWGVAALAILLFVFTALGMTIAPAPPSALAMASSSLATVVAVCAIILWLGRRPRAGRP